MCLIVVVFFKKERVKVLKLSPICYLSVVLIDSQAPTSSRASDVCGTSPRTDASSAIRLAVSTDT